MPHFSEYLNLVAAISSLLNFWFCREKCNQSIKVSTFSCVKHLKHFLWLRSHGRLGTIYVTSDFFFFLFASFLGSFWFFSVLPPCVHKVSLKLQHSVTSTWSDKGSVQCSAVRWSTVVCSWFIRAVRGRLDTVICAEIAHNDHHHSSKNSPYCSLPGDTVWRHSIVPLSQLSFPTYVVSNRSGHMTDAHSPGI